MQELVWGGQWEILYFRAIKFGGDVVEFTTSIRITSGCLAISPHKIIWLFPDNFLVSLTKKCITDDLLLTFVNKIWVQPFELVFKTHNQLPDSGQNGLDNNLQTTFSNTFSSVGLAISGLSESKTMLDPIKHSIFMKVKDCHYSKTCSCRLCYQNSGWYILWSNRSCNVINKDI